MATASVVIQANPPTHAPSPPSWEMLPPDVLRFIFRFFTHRPRLYCVSVVCKRWRAVALRSVKAAVLPKVPNEEPLMYQRLPSLTDVRVRRERLPASTSVIRTLRVTLSATTLVKLDANLRLFSLTYFSFTGATTLLQPLLAMLSARTATGLTSLHLSLPYSNYGKYLTMPADKKLAILFPHLTDFSFASAERHHSTLTDLGTHLLHAHASQLTRLNLTDHPHSQNHSELIGLSFPRVTSLRLGSSLWHDMSRLIGSFPVLAEVDAHSWHLNELREKLPKLASLVVAIEEHSIHYISPEEYPNLRELRGDPSYPRSEEQLSRITEARLAPYVSTAYVCIASKPELLAPFTNLTNLRLAFGHMTACLPQLPKLKFVSFTLHYGRTTQSNALKFMADTVTYCMPPRVQCVKFDLALPESPAIIEELRAVLRSMKDKEVAKVVWQLQRINAEGEAVLREFSNPWMHVVHAVSYDPTRCEDEMIF